MDARERQGLPRKCPPGECHKLIPPPPVSTTIDSDSEWRFERDGSPCSPVAASRTPSAAPEYPIPLFIAHCVQCCCDAVCAVCETGEYPEMVFEECHKFRPHTQHTESGDPVVFEEHKFPPHAQHTESGDPVFDAALAMVMEAASEGHRGHDQLKKSVAEVNAYVKAKLDALAAVGKALETETALRMEWASRAHTEAEARGVHYSSVCMCPCGTCGFCEYVEDEMDQREYLNKYLED
jgi:hypothetical protein